MASIANDRNGTRRLLFVDGDGTRKTIRLGRVSKKTAETIRVHVEHLVRDKSHGLACPPSTAAWLSEIGDTLHAKLAKVGLVAPRSRLTLDELLDAFLSANSGAKPGTLVAWRQVMRDLRQFFGPDRDVTALTTDDGERFRLHLQQRGLGDYTILKRLQKARQFFRYGVRRGWLAKSPLADVTHRGGSLDARQHYVPEADALRLIDAAPSLVWRTIFALSRFGGLRCPSEVLSLTWADIDWATSAMRVGSPKTEHHAGGACRVVPIFARLRPYLEAAWDAAEEGQTHVIPEGLYLPASKSPAGWRNANLRTTATKIVRRAGLEPWPKLFHALRASCETDLAAEHPIGAVCKWIGNTRAIAARHYLVARDEDFERAIRGGAKSGALMAPDCAQRPPAPGCGNAQESPEPLDSCSVMQPGASRKSLLQNDLMEDSGLEPLTF